MLYKVSDIALDYAPGEEIIGTVEADSPEAAILAALKAISPSMAVNMADAARNQPDDFEKYVLPAFKAEPVLGPCVGHAVAVACLPCKLFRLEANAELWRERVREYIREAIAESRRDARETAN
jgi:hypothetical protein